LIRFIREIILSSSKDPNITIKQLDLTKKVKKKASIDDRTFRRTVRSDHGYPTVSLPKFFLEIGLQLNQEVIVEKRGKGSNPLNWEIVIKPRVQKRQRTEQGQ
jgi:hypothetical protein